MRTIHVKIAEQRLAELDHEVQESLGGAWYLRLSAPEVGVLVAGYRYRDELLMLLVDLAEEGRIEGLGDPVAEVNDQTGVLGRVNDALRRAADSQAGPE